MSLLLSPHDDDNALFAAFTCTREKPLVVVCTDSFIQPARGEHGCSATERAVETEAACRVLGCSVTRLGIPDSTATEEDIYKMLMIKFYPCGYGPEKVYAPALQGGNRHHDMVARVARQIYGNRVIEYTTYTPTLLWTTGQVEIIPTPEELMMKERALQCYPSQLRINWPHFQAVIGKSEWLNIQ